MLWLLEWSCAAILLVMGALELFVLVRRRKSPWKRRIPLLAALLTIFLAVVEGGTTYFAHESERERDQQIAELKKHQPRPPRRLMGKTIQGDLVERVRATPGTEVQIDFEASDREARDFADDMHDAFDKLGYKVSKNTVVGAGSDVVLEVSTKGEAPFDPLWRFAIYLRDQGFHPTILQGQPKNRVTIGAQPPP